MTAAPAKSPATLTPARVFWFYLPLAAMWLTMGVELPIITAFVARLPQAKENLAAFGISFTLALMVESPVIMLLTAATALAHNRAYYGRLLGFTHVLAVSLTFAHLLIALTPLYHLLVDGVIGAPEIVIEPSRRAFLTMTPWTAAIAYRRLWQGVLIRFKRTAVVPLTMIARLAMVFLVMAVGFGYDISGATLGALALSCGVVASAVAAFAFSRAVVWRMPGAEESTAEDAPTLSWRRLIAFYVPLALTSMLSFVRRPLLSIGIARAPEPLSSLAVWPVIGSVLFVFGSMAIAAQEVVVALMGERRSFAALQRFTRVLSTVLAGLLALIAFTPLCGIWYRGLAGLPAELAAFARVPTMVLFMAPGLETMLAWNRGLLVHEKRTGIISQAVGLNLAVLVMIMFGGAALTSLTGATTASIALAGALSAEAGLLWWRRRAGPAACPEISEGDPRAGQARARSETLCCR